MCVERSAPTVKSYWLYKTGPNFRHAPLYEGQIVHTDLDMPDLHITIAPPIAHITPTQRCKESYLTTIQAEDEIENVLSLRDERLRDEYIITAKNAVVDQLQLKSSLILKREDYSIGESNASSKNHGNQCIGTPPRRLREHIRQRERWMCDDCRSIFKGSRTCLKCLHQKVGDCVRLQWVAISSKSQTSHWNWRFCDWHSLRGQDSYDLEVRLVDRAHCQLDPHR
jgi:hypothetical protein